MKCARLGIAALFFLLAGCASQKPPVSGSSQPTILTQVTQLTRGFDKAGEAYFSNDMKWIIFQAVPPSEKQYQMYVAPLNLFPGKAPAIGRAVRITPSHSRNTCGFFAPDNSAIIFASTAGKENPDEPTSGYQRQGGSYKWDFPPGMEIYRAKDWQKRVLESWRISPYAAGVAFDQPDRGPHYLRIDLATPDNRLTENNAYDAECAYSPDGKWICFTSFRTGEGDVWVMRADGSHPVQITHAKGYDGGPFFSPDGRRLVYRSDRKGNDLLQIFVADLVFDEHGDITGVTGERQLTNDQNVNWGPYWYPDGQHIIFATSRHGHQNYELYAIRDDGSHPTRITNSPGFDGLPVFSPDGKYLMWTSKRAPDNTSQVFIAQFHAPAAEW